MTIYKNILEYTRISYKNIQLVYKSYLWIPNQSQLHIHAYVCGQHHHLHHTYLGSQVFRSSTEGSCGGSVANVFFAKAKVCQLDVSIRVKKKVLQLVGTGRKEGRERRKEGGGRREEGGGRRKEGGRRREEGGGRREGGGREQGGGRKEEGGMEEVGGKEGRRREVGGIEDEGRGRENERGMREGWRIGGEEDRDVCMRCMYVRTYEGIYEEAALADEKHMRARARAHTHTHTHLQVTVDDVVLMQVSDGQGDFSAVEAGSVLGEDALPREMEEQLSSVDVLHDKT